MAERTLLFEETTKRIYTTDREDQVLQEFTDNTLSGKEAKKSRVKNKGVLSNSIAAHLFEYLEGYNIPTYYVGTVNERQMLVKRVEPLPVEVVLRNVASGSFCERYQIKDGTLLKYPVMDYYLKDDTLEDRLVSESFLSALGHATPDEMRHISRLAAKINAVLKDYFERREVTLVDFRIEFGRLNNQIYLCNEITPENCTIWGSANGEKVAKSRFLLSTGSPEKVYKDFHNLILS